MLRKATIIGPSRPCAKSTSLAIAHIVSNTLGFVVQQCVLNQSQGYWLLLDALAVAISLVYQMWTYCLTPDSIETQDFDGELQVFR